MAYFRNFPITEYNFGDEINPVLFQNLSTYTDVIDQISDNVSFYEKYEVLSGDRPDIVSSKLYRSPDYYWTFFLLNNDLRESGWPLQDYEILDLSKKYYPNYVFVTQNDISSTYQVGTKVVGASSGAEGTIIKRDLDLGQIIITPDGAGTDFLGDTTLLNEVGDVQESLITIRSQVAQHLSVHHYEDTDGNWVDINPYNQITTNLIPITYYDRLLQKNQNLRSIKVFKPSVIRQVDIEFQRLVRL